MKSLQWPLGILEQIPFATTFLSLRGLVLGLLLGLCGNGTGYYVIMQPELPVMTHKVTKLCVHSSNPLSHGSGMLAIRSKQVLRTQVCCTGCVLSFVD